MDTHAYVVNADRYSDGGFALCRGKKSFDHLMRGKKSVDHYLRGRRAEDFQR